MVNEHAFTTYTCSIDKDAFDKPIVSNVKSIMEPFLISCNSFVFKRKTHRILAYKKTHLQLPGQKYSKDRMNFERKSLKTQSLGLNTTVYHLPQ